MTNDPPRPSFWVVIPPPIWALFFVLAALWITRALGLGAPLRFSLAGWALLILGFVVSASGRLAFAKAGTEVIPASKKNSVLVTTGVFHYSRNPMYLGIVILLLGVAFLTGPILAFVAVVGFFLFVNFISIPYEEDKMERQFGEEYLAYKRRVRRWI